MFYYNVFTNTIIKIFRSMIKITHRGREVKVGDKIPIDGIRINGVPLITPIKLDNSVILTQRLAELNPNIFTVEEIPDYFECINARFNSSFTLGKIYKLENTYNYPEKLAVKCDYGDVIEVFYWDKSYIKKGHNCFKPTTKQAFEKQEMLAKAKKDYPVGTVFRSLITPDQIQEVTEATHSVEIAHNGDLYAIVRTDKHLGGGCLFNDGKWAEILKLKYISEDGVKIYDRMKTYRIEECYMQVNSFFHDTWAGDSKDVKYFYHKENAEQYLKDVKFKKELLIEARKRYPIGTKFISATNPYVKSSYTVQHEVIWKNDRIVTEEFGAAVYDHSTGIWAEILEITLIEKLSRLILSTPSGKIRNTLSEAFIQVQMNEKCIILTKNDLRIIPPFNLHDVQWQDFKESSMTKQEYLEAEVVIFICESLSKVLKNKY